jgi:hypothetical protein
MSCPQFMSSKTSIQRASLTQESLIPEF